MAALRSRSALVPALCLAAAALLVCSGPAFLSPAPARAASAAEGHALVAPAAALLATPLAAQAAEEFPTPVLGLGVLSIVVVIVLLISGVTIFRGLVETIDDI
mmetsp:Transcript_117774/g.345010  ORF Transcript_117774/g.345010 Transcript_117774/m.345010 type:complete len:103 (-) Transcript_117774:127-435(-)